MIVFFLTLLLLAMFFVLLRYEQFLYSVLRVTLFHLNAVLNLWASYLKTQTEIPRVSIYIIPTKNDTIYVGKNTETGHFSIPLFWKKIDDCTPFFPF